MPCNAAALRDLLNDRLAPVAVADVEAHLEDCPECRAALDRLAGGESWASAVREELVGTPGLSERTTLDADDDDPLDFLAPSEFPDSLGRVGPYEVKGILGRGGNGIVLKAFDAGLNRFVAVKVIASVLAGSAAARARFTREARAAAAVVHENVVAVHGVDQAGGLPYLVMEYVKGRSAQDKLDRLGPLPVVEVLRIAHQTASGLAAAHAQGLVHRDIKPANILLENGVERVKLTDFGLARAVTDACLTQSGVIAGTPYYMAPEQARGETVDHRADLFSLGSTLYALLAGRPPFRADTPLAVLRRVTDDPARPLRESNPDVPDWLERAIGRLMAKDPNDRYQSAADTAKVFERCLAHVQNPLVEPPPNVPRVRWSRRSIPLTRVAAGMMATAALVAGGWAIDKYRATDEVAQVGSRTALESDQLWTAPVDREKSWNPTHVKSEEVEQGLERMRVELTEAAEMAMELRHMRHEDRLDGWLAQLRESLAMAAELQAAHLPNHLADPVASGLSAGRAGLRVLSGSSSSDQRNPDPITAGLTALRQQLTALELELARDRRQTRTRRVVPVGTQSNDEASNRILIRTRTLRGVS